MPQFNYKDHYCDDDYYNEEDYEEDISPEDQEQMEIGTIQVREALDKSSVRVNVTTKQIQEALWHYYWDVGKSVSYITKNFAVKPEPLLAIPASQAGKSSHKPHSKLLLYVSESVVSPPPTQPWADKKKEMALMPPSSFPDEIDLQSQRTGDLTVSPEISFASFFSDTPWMNVPKYRLGSLTPPSIPSAGGLLGGAPSKLQALAARRKRKTDVKPPPEPPEVANRLAVPSKEDNSVCGVTEKVEDSKFPYPKEQSHSESPPERRGIEEEENFSCLVAEPSAFASALFSSDEEKRSRLPVQDRYPIPSYMTKISQQLPPIFDFSTPSPDDMVLAAQEKGLAKANRK